MSTFTDAQARLVVIPSSVITADSHASRRSCAACSKEGYLLSASRRSCGTAVVVDTENSPTGIKKIILFKWASDQKKKKKDSCEQVHKRENG